MTPLREAVTLPALFLTVTLLGAIRIGAPIAIEPPTQFSLVLAMLLLSVLVQSGTLVGARLMHGARTPLANLNGLVMLLCAFAASAQTLSLITPDEGLPAVVVGFVLLAMLVQMLAVSLDRQRFLRGLMVMLGVAFVLKFIVLAALSSPASGRVTRALQVLFDNVTLGAVTQPAFSPANGYLAFATLLLYLFGLSRLPHADWRMVRVGAERLPPAPGRAEQPDQVARRRG
jgi:hypothetical protein